MAYNETGFGSALLEGLREAVAWKRGELALETVNIDPMPADRVREIRRKVAEAARHSARSAPYKASASGT